MSYYEERIKQLGGKPQRKRPKKGQLTKVGAEIAKSADRRLVTASIAAGALGIPTSLITQFWRTNEQDIED